MVTLIGFLFIIANVGLLELMDPDLLGPKQQWVYYSYAAGMWMYSTSKYTITYSLMQSGIIWFISKPC